MPWKTTHSPTKYETKEEAEKACLNEPIVHDKTSPLVGQLPAVVEVSDEEVEEAP